MLYITRKLGQSLIINDDIEITLVDVKRGSAKLGVVFPADATVLRKEAYERVRDENISVAAKVTNDDLMAALASLKAPIKPVSS
jgi:carbon storage regulator